MSDNVEIVKKTQPLKRRQKLAMALLGVVILSSGFVLGASSTFFVLREKIRPLPSPFPSGRILQRLIKDLQLTDDQQPHVKLLLDKQAVKISERRKEAGEKSRTQLEEMVASMKTILTDEQFAKFEPDFNASRERMQERWNRWRQGGGRRGGGGQRPGSNREQRRDKHQREDGPPGESQPGPKPNQRP